MNLEQLHSIPKFTELFTDARFVGLTMYLRKRRPKASQKEPHGMIQDSGKIDAYLELLDLMEDAKVPPQQNFEPKKPQPYTSQIPLPDTNK